MSLASEGSIPPRGWNSWDCYGMSVTEAEVLANAAYLRDRLLVHGWDTVVIDHQWYDPESTAGEYNPSPDFVMDGFGRFQPDPLRFPSAADGNGFTSLARSLHDDGLRFGLHLMRGIPRKAVDLDVSIDGTGYTARDIADTSDACGWNEDMWGLNVDHPGAAAYYRSVAQQLADWGVDFVKADNMLDPYHRRDVELLREGLDATGRSISLSLSPGYYTSTLDADHLSAHATMWRVTDDLWDDWSSVKDLFQRFARWAPYANDGAWPDGDMLPLGRIGIRAQRGIDRQSRLTLDEQRTLVTLWCIARSPLFFGGDFPTSPLPTLALLENAAVLGVHANGSHPREILHEESLIVWHSRHHAADDQYVAVFNTGDASLRRGLWGPAFGANTGSRLTDLWTSEPMELRNDGRLDINLPPHSSRLFSITE